MKNYLNTHFDLDKIAGMLDEVPIWSAPFGLKLLDAVDYKPNLSVLDIGFGTGYPLTELAMRLGSSAVVYGIDPWKAAAERVKKKIDYYGITNVRLMEGSAESIPLEDNSIDLITSNNGINNIPDMEKVFSECSRVIKKGGQFIQTMNTSLSMVEFYGVLESVLREMGMEHEIKLMHQHIVQKRPPISFIIAILRKYGFLISDLEQDQFNYKFTDGTAMLNYHFIRLAFMDSWKTLLPSDKTGQIFDAIETRLNEQAHTLGGLKLSIPFVLINAVKR